jgi:hypothetical protein
MIAIGLVLTAYYANAAWRASMLPDPQIERGK